MCLVTLVPLATPQSPTTTEETSRRLTEDPRAGWPVPSRRRNRPLQVTRVRPTRRTSGREVRRPCVDREVYVSWPHEGRREWFGGCRVDPFVGPSVTPTCSLPPHPQPFSVRPTCSWSPPSFPGHTRTVDLGVVYPLTSSDDWRWNCVCTFWCEYQRWIFPRRFTDHIRTLIE